MISHVLHLESQATQTELADKLYPFSHIRQIDGIVGEHFKQLGSQTAGWIIPFVVANANCPEFFLKLIHSIGPAHASQLSAQGKHSEPSL